MSVIQSYMQTTRGSKICPTQQKKQRSSSYGKTQTDVAASLLHDLQIKQNQICTGTYNFALRVSLLETVLELRRFLRCRLDGPGIATSFPLPLVSSCDCPFMPSSTLVATSSNSRSSSAFSKSVSLLLGSALLIVCSVLINQNKQIQLMFDSLYRQAMLVVWEHGKTRRSMMMKLM